MAPAARPLHRVDGLCGEILGLAASHSPRALSTAQQSKAIEPRKADADVTAALGGGEKGPLIEPDPWLLLLLVGFFYFAVRDPEWDGDISGEDGQKSLSVDNGRVCVVMAR